MYDKVLFADEDLDEQLSSGKVCVGTFLLDFINDNPIVDIEGKSYAIQVCEIALWCPEIKKPKDDAINDGEAQKEENDLSDDEDAESIDEESENEKNDDGMNQFLPDDPVFL
ncbi:unnamed protein product [Lactuca virosa]|uniref:Uncharacterized protein n=1 Tax=Lactuca virosa TaxID=75947 RepID=A0AAU9MTP9_9ASTR|nr:unnamed protein product [Lactuca virosa]